MSAATIEELLHDSEDRLDTAKHVHSDQQAVAQAAIAQVLATQALVAATQAQTEQMRIGNLVALAFSESDIFYQLPDTSPYKPIFASIREGLGVE